MRGGGLRRDVVPAFSPDDEQLLVTRYDRADDGNGGPSHIVIVQTRVLVEQVGAIDMSRLGDLAGHLTLEEQWGVDAALLTVLGLS